jgi:hypothetical protein
MFFKIERGRIGQQSRLPGKATRKRRRSPLTSDWFVPGSVQAVRRLQAPTKRVVSVNTVTTNSFGIPPRHAALGLMDKPRNVQSDLQTSTQRRIAGSATAPGGRRGEAGRAGGHFQAGQTPRAESVTRRVR